MSVEAFVISGLVEEGSPRRAYQAGLALADFDMYDEEFAWLEKRAENHQPINRFLFKSAFPDFEWVTVSMSLDEILREFKNERVFVDGLTAQDELANGYEADNALDKLLLMRDRIIEIASAHAPKTEIDMGHNWEAHLERIKQIRIMRNQGVTVGIPTGIPNIEHHLGGLLPGRVIVVLGRPGDSKSCFVVQCATSAFLDKRRVGIFSPELDEFENQCRVSTWLSANPEIQKECGLRGAFRNRALMEGTHFNRKTYKRFLQYIDSLPGQMILFTQKYRKARMTPGYIESRIDALGLDLVIVDPIYKLKGPRRRDSPVWEIQDLTDSLAFMAESYNIPIIITNQAHRQGRKDDAPSKDNSFGSDAPAQEGDHVLGLKHFSEERRLIIRCSKNRFGHPFRIECDFRPNVGIMKDITPIRGDYFNSTDDELNEMTEAEAKEWEES